MNNDDDGIRFGPLPGMSQYPGRLRALAVVGMAVIVIVVALVAFLALFT